VAVESYPFLLVFWALVTLVRGWKKEVPGFCLIPGMDVEISTYAVPTKLFEYLACGRPLACTLLHGTVPTLIRQYGVGVVADVDQLTIARRAQAPVFRHGVSELKHEPNTKYEVE
jgi:hypothetical protein